jgi:hypothetical protein
MFWNTILNKMSFLVSRDEKTYKGTEEWSIVVLEGGLIINTHTFKITNLSTFPSTFQKNYKRTGIIHVMDFE